ncbi:HAD family hydrolase [Candidatus Parcubacteria bacterium]|nr:MAG: HAD family hydrolase [Candidatus Parcubacteria bacterium]
MIKAVIFDADGMLLTGEMFSKRLSKEYGIDENLIEPFFDTRFRDYIVVGKADLKKEIKKYLGVWGWKRSLEELLTYWFQGNDLDLRVIEVIKKLRSQGIKCYLCTNQEKYRARYLINDLGFKSVFDNIFVSSFIGYKKPQREFFEHVMRELPEIKKGEILFWDDREKYIEGAKKFGFKTELYINFEGFREKIKKYFNI